MMTTLCRDCSRPLASPFRVYGDRGRVIIGCVSADHDGHLRPLSESSHWHNRPEAKKIRRGLSYRVPIGEVRS